MLATTQLFAVDGSSARAPRHPTQAPTFENERNGKSMNLRLCKPLLIFLLFALSPLAFAKPDATAATAPNVTRTTLDNGLRV
ncbi:MAG TPA: hypothetical protein VF022_04620, partial [Rhodanobacteraceae bacterium]